MSRVLASVMGFVLFSGCDQHSSPPAGIAPTDPFQKAVLKHLESNERGVQVLEWYPPATLRGAYFIPQKHADEKGPIPAQKRWVPVAETGAETSGRAVRCVFKTDKGFGDWSGEQDMVFIVSHDLHIVNYANSDDFTTDKPDEESNGTARTKR